MVFDPSKDPTAFPQPADGPMPNFAGATLPATLGGLPQRGQLKSYFGTYGTGASIVAVGFFPEQTPIRQLRRMVDSPGRPPIKGAFGEGSLITTPLLNGLLFTYQGAGYFLLGTVTRAQLEKMALDLEHNPPQPIGGVPNGIDSGSGSGSAPAGSEGP
jgi:hypothetical protein